MSEPLIQLKGIERRYQSGEQEVTVLHPLDLTIEAGEMIAIVGASGCPGLSPIAVLSPPLGGLFIGDRKSVV